MTVARTSDVTATRALAASVARHCRVGDLIVLAGDMGAGKTAFAQGFARGLDIDEHVTSPTFTLVRSYPVPVKSGRPRVFHHLDVYRLDRLNEVADLAIGELVDDRSVTLIEWGDAVLDALPKDRLVIEFAFGDGDDDRIITFDATASRSWSTRLADMADVLQAWS